MIIGKVAGSVVATRKHDRLVGFKLLIVEPLDEKLLPLKTQRFVAVDNLGAGLGELVLVATGSAARTSHQDSPVDAAIVGIIDSADTINTPVL